MHFMKKKLFVCLVSLILIAVLSFGVSAEWNKNYTLTGDYSADILEVARAQIGKSGKELGFSTEWCAYFVSKCASYAGIPQSVVKYTGYAAPGCFGLDYYNSQHNDGNYIPKPGDLIFYCWSGDNKNWSHVGIVEYVEGDTVHTIEGNSGTGKTLAARLNDPVMRHEYKLSSKSIRAYSSLTSAPSKEVVTIPEGKYRIVCALGNEHAAIEISNGSKQKKGNAQLWQIHDGTCQQWYLQKNGDYYKIKNVNSGLFLDVDDGKAQNNRNVWQWTSNKTNAQNWIFEDAGNGYVYIKTVLGDYYLDAQNAKSDNGTNIQIYQFNPAYNAQKFKLVRLDAPSYYFDVNGTLDGKAADLYGYGTVDVYIDSVLVADDVSDYYKKHPEGTHYEIKDIKALDGRSYDGVVSGSLSGTIVGGDTAVNLRFSTKTHTHTWKIAGNEAAHPHKEFKVCSCGASEYTGNTIYDSNCNDCLPAAPTVRISKNQYSVGETIFLNWSSAVRADYYELKCYNAETDNMDYVDWGINGTSCEFSLPVGNYYVYIVSINNNMVSAGCSTYWKASEPITFSVVEAPKKSNTYTLYYDANGGVEPPSPQSVQEGDTVKISRVEPGRKDYVFAGWSFNRNGNEADLTGGDELFLSSDKTIYAIWKQNSVKAIVLTIGSTVAEVSGKTIYNDVAPLVINDRTMLPARFVAENLGVDVQWDADKECVIIDGRNRYIELFVGSNFAKVDGEPQALDSAPFIENGRTYCPVRFICEALGADVEWIEESQRVVIRG